MRRQVMKPHWWDQTNPPWSVIQQIKKYGFVGSATTINHLVAIIVLFVSTFIPVASFENVYLVLDKE